MAVPLNLWLPGLQLRLEVVLLCEFRALSRGWEAEPQVQLVLPFILDCLND